MARRRTPIGTYGVIHTTKIREKTKGRSAIWEARTRFRLRNGRVLRPRRRGPSESAAVDELKAALVKLADEVSGKKISPDTRFGHVADLWLAELERKVAEGERAPKTLYDYRDTVRNHVKKQFGEMTCREVQEDVGFCDEVIKGVKDGVRKALKKGGKRGESGVAAARRVRAVLSGICAYAVRNQAMTANPIKSVEAIAAAAEAKPIRALEPGERGDFLAKLAAAVKARAEDPKRRLGVRAQGWLDLPDLALAGLATGGRIGEVLALAADDVDPRERKVALSHHLIRVEGVGIVRQPLRKGNRAVLVVRVPSWSVEMFRRRKLESGGGTLFRTWNGELEDPGNVMKRLRKVCDEIGYGWVTSHVFRKTTASHLGDSDISSEAIADQLGNTRDVVEGHYRRPQIANEKTAGALESMFDVPAEGAEEGEEGEETG
ncbi:tyrosine-type recombinase/integrase [Amycolatopsis taiwanensis]|uniref:tyrosine-type recombinase/integrase n=1 Tax=Amycolatopsis taiwanensis TaxID=342230 RepID=UPI0004841576|nr:tyrosine-type recombinase/integrase [Amycolatopsis taiwanensis]